MILTTVDTYSIDRVIDFDIEQLGMTLTVKAGTGDWRGEDVVLVEDETYTVPSRPNELALRGYLIQVVASGEYHVLVDAIEKEAGDEAFNFADWPEYQLKSSLFMATVPGGVVSLDEVAVMRNRMIAPPPEEE